MSSSRVNSSCRRDFIWFLPILFRPLPRSFMPVCARTCGATALMRPCRHQTSTEFDIRASDQPRATPASRTTLRRLPCGAWLGSMKRLVRVQRSSWSQFQMKSRVHHCYVIWWILLKKKNLICLRAWYTKALEKVCKFDITCKQICKRLYEQRASNVPNSMRDEYVCSVRLLCQRPQNVATGRCKLVNCEKSKKNIKAWK